MKYIELGKDDNIKQLQVLPFKLIKAKRTHLQLYLEEKQALSSLKGWKKYQLWNYSPKGIC